MPLASGRLGDAQQASTRWAFNRPRASPSPGDDNRRQGQPTPGTDAAGDGGDDLRPASAVLVVGGEIFLAEIVTPDFDLAGELVHAFLRLAALDFQLRLTSVPGVERAGPQLLQPGAGLVGEFCVVTGPSLGFGERRQLLSLGVEIALQFFERAVIGDRAGVEPIVGDFNPALSGLDDGVGLAHGLVGDPRLLFLGFDFGFKLCNERRIGNLVEDGLELAPGLISLDVDFLELLQPFEVHGWGSFSYPGPTGAKGLSAVRDA